MIELQTADRNASKLGWFVQGGQAALTSRALRGEPDLTSTSLREIVRRGTLVVPAERQWIIRDRKAKLTSGSLREIVRRGTLVVPGEAGWIINRYSSDPTSGSLRMG